ncbi:MAG: OmpA family protein [Methylobacter sp.]|nr:OmpA family protein [Methylobacter sp.]
MNMILKTLYFCIASFAINAYAGSDEMNFGKAAPSDSAIIEHFKSASTTQHVDTAAPAGDGYQDVSDNDLQSVRGLRKINTLSTSLGQKTKHSPDEPEKAISLQITFDYNSSDLRDQTLVQLDPVGRALSSADLRGMKFRVEGHTDTVGSEEFNIELSRRRADAVKLFLMQKYGLAASSIQVEGKGKFDLADSSHPTSEINRRVRIVSLGQN